MDNLQIATIALIVASLGFLLSLFSYLSSMRKTRADIFLSLRQTYLNIHKGLPYQIKDSVPVDKGSEDWDAIEMYWLNVFNEWYITNKSLKHECKKLWKEYYAGAIASSVHDENMRRVLEDLLVERNYSFGSFHKEFKECLFELEKPSNE